MNIGIGLPATVPGATGDMLLRWAVQAEDRGFSSLAVNDRLVYGNYEPLVALTAAASVTERIRLTTAILLAPLRINQPLLAKQLATLDNFAPGRLTVGLGVGSREDDFDVAGADFHTRGHRMDDLLNEMTRIWSGDSDISSGNIGPRPATAGGPELLIGGMSDATIRRIVRYGNGWVSAGPARLYIRFAERVAKAWQESGREGSPRNIQTGFFALGPEAREDADAFISDYYGFAPRMARAIARGAAVTPTMIEEYIAAHEEAGCDEVIFLPCTADLEQINLLAGIALARG